MERVPAKFSEGPAKVTHVPPEGLLSDGLSFSSVGLKYHQIWEVLAFPTSLHQLKYQHGASENDAQSKDPPGR